MRKKIKTIIKKTTERTKTFIIPRTNQQDNSVHSTKKMFKATVRMAKMTLLVFMRRHPIASRLILFVAVALMLFALIADPLQIFLRREPLYTRNVEAKIEQLLPEKTEYFNGSIQYKEKELLFAFNEGYNSIDRPGFGGGAKFSANIHINSIKGIDVIDASSGVQISIIPKFKLGNAKRDNNRIFYDLGDKDGMKVVSLGASGYKEDIILKRYQGNKLSFSYDLVLPDGLEARLEADGSIGFYGVETLLLGNVSAGSEEDEKLLEKARNNGDKTNLLFRIPAPIVLEADRQKSVADAYFELEGSRLTTVATNLKQANYPISIDPSVYVESARKFLRGNEETNVDFDVDNELIQKGTTTGARFNGWNSTMDLNGGRFDGGSVTAGGFAYYVGGVSGSADENSTSFSTPGTATWNVPTGVTSVTVELWGGGGGGGAGGTASVGGAGGGGGYASATLPVTPSETITVDVGGAGGAGTFSATSGNGAGGGGHSEVRRGSTRLVIAPGGGGGGGGDNSSATPGGAGGAGGDDNSGLDGTSSGSAGGGFGASSSSGGGGGTSSNNNGEAGGLETGGLGADGRTNQSGADGAAGGGGTNGGGNGGVANEDAAGYAGGGGGGGGYYGGGGGGGSVAGDAGGGGGGGGTAYFDGGASGVTASSGSGQTPGNDADSDRAGAGQGGNGGGTNSNGSGGTNGIVVIKYYTNVTNDVEPTVYWANIDDNSGVVNSPNPGAGACTDWCTESVYDLPEERRGFSLVAYNGFMYAIGGQNGSGTRQSTVYIAKIGANGEPQLWHPTDPNKNNWVYWYADTALPEAVSYSAAVGYNNRLYLVGGQTDANQGGVATVRYTEIEPTGTLANWTTTGVVSLSTARFMHSLEVYNDNMYVIGGDSSSSGALLNSVEYVKLADNGTFKGTWESTSGFAGARRTNGGKFTTVYGAYIYLTGGCISVSGGNCQGVGNEVQIASIFADGSLGEWSIDSDSTNPRVGYGMHSWQGNVYRIGGCEQIISTSNGCVVALDSVDYGVINPPGEVSTVNITEASGNGNCVGGNPRDCDLPPLGDGAGQGGQMLSMAIVLNGYLYNIGGCTNFACSTSSGNVSYVQIGSDGSLQRESTCVANGNSYADSGNSAWCVDSTNRVNGTSGISAAGATIFNNRIYLVGGIDESTTGTQSIYYNDVNTDGSLTGAWSSVSFAAAGLTGYSELSYTYVFARANPNQAATNPGNLFVLGGCDNFGASAGCSNSYASETYKCNITTTGSVSGCTTTGQLQIDAELSTGGVQGLGLHSGTVYANYIYLIGGFSQNVGDRDTVFYAKIDDSNNIVDVESGTAGGAGDDWIESDNTLDVGRRRGWAFGYNGHIYAVGGYDDTGTGIIPFIEWSKLNVSDGSLEPFVTSTITINQRWGLTMVVSNSFAYVMGGCDVGPSPGGCSSFEPSVQTFQLYNNDSGAQASYEESVGGFATSNNRIGSSSAILDGYIYVAGGRSGGSVTSNVQVAKLNDNGSIGVWSDTSTPLPAPRAYGQLEVVGGSLYYIGGEDAAGDERSEVYHATPTTGSSSLDVIKTTTYKLGTSEYAGLNYTLTLNENLESNYFVMIAGGDNTTNTSGPDHSQVRVDGDPFGNLTATTAANELRLIRGDNTASWDGTVTVVECVSNCGTDGFQLTEVLDVSLASGNTSTDVTLGSAHTSRTVPIGGYLGGGLSTSEANSNNFSATAGIRTRKNSTNQIRIERNATAGTAAAADVTIYVVEWGSVWNVQEANIDNWNTGGQGVDDVSEYATTSISSVTRDNTWVWKSPGTSEDDGLGDGAFGKVVTLGDGVNQNPTENTIAIGAEPAQAGDIRDDTIYVMEHPDLNSDYRFISRANYGTSFTATVDAALVSETVATAGNVTSSEGFRIPLFYYTDNGTGTAYTRVAGWSHYHSNTTTVSLAKGYSGNNHSGWIQSVDFGGMAGSSGGGDIASWSTATNGLPAARSQFGAAVWNDRIYAVGGLDSSGSPTNTVYISPKLSSGGDITSVWATDNDLPEVARSGGAVMTYANNLYLLGGNDGTNYLSDVQFSSIGYKSGTIAQTGNTLTGTGTTWTSSMVGSEVFYADGSRATITSFTNATTLIVDASKVVDPGTRYLIDDGSVGEWSYTTSLTQQVSDADGFAANGFMYLFGGRSAEGVCTNNSYVAPISANTTISSGNNPTGLGEWYQTNVEFAGARHSSAIAYNEGKVYISGGGCASSLSTTYTFDADNDADESAWSFVSDNGGNGLNSSGTNRSWSHDTDDTPSGNVGPTSGQGGDPDGYVYTESTAPASAGDTFTMTLNSTLDASVYDWTVEFFWNQRGDDNTATVQLQTNENSAGWVTEATYGSGGPDVNSGGTQQWNLESLDLSSAISDSSTEIRFLVTLGSTGNIWHNDFALDTITVSGVETGSDGELTSNQHYYGTLRAQPQVARYSYYIDADSNVFPDAWLLNGLDNNIGARWQFGYRSAADSSNVFLNETFTGTDSASLTPASTTDFSTCYVVNGSSSAASRFDSTHSVSPSTSAEFVANGGGSYAGCYDTTEDSVVRYDKFYIRPQSYATLSAPVQFYQAANTDPSYETIGALRIASDGTIEVRDKNTTDQTFSPLTINMWHRIEVGLVNDQMTVRIYRDSNLNGNVPDDEVTINLDSASADEFNEVRVGINGPINNNYALNIDDFESSSSDWIGGPGKSWGQDTNFGDVTLGRVENYIPLDGSGNDTNFARYYYVTISIDASQTFGYPDDVTRGPTIDDFSLFFTSDPNKRLRHGKTFIQGLQQPLDTPCRVSGASPAGSQPNCPLP